MYIALCIAIAGIAAGRIFRKFIPIAALKNSIFGAVLGLLFLLGLQIGANELLISRLKDMGWQALLLTLAALAGSIAAVLAINRITRLPLGSLKRDA